MKNSAFWNVGQCVPQCVVATCRFHFQGRRSRQLRNQYEAESKQGRYERGASFLLVTDFLPGSTFYPEEKEDRSSKSLLILKHATRRHIPADINPQSHYCANVTGILFVILEFLDVTSRSSSKFEPSQTDHFLN